MFVSDSGLAPLAPGWMSLTRTVPALLPSLFQSSVPLVPLSALKYKIPLTSAKTCGLAPLEPARISRIRATLVTTGPTTTVLGTSFTAVTLTENVWTAEVSTPPLAVPPSSCNCTVTIAEPLAFDAGV